MVNNKYDNQTEDKDLNKDLDKDLDKDVNKVEETNPVIKFYKGLGYEDKETEFNNKYGGDILDIHTDMQIYCEDALLGIYDKKSYCAFTEFVKKYSSKYHYFEDYIVEDYKNQFPEDGIKKEESTN